MKKKKETQQKQQGLRLEEQDLRSNSTTVGPKKKSIFKSWALLLDFFLSDSQHVHQISRAQMAAWTGKGA